MHLIFNELSFYPLAEHTYSIEENFRVLLKTFGKIKEEFGFTHIRFPLNFSSQNATTTSNFSQWIGQISNPTLKNLVLGLVKAPFIDDFSEEDLSEYILNHFIISDTSCPRREDPFGLVIAHLKSVPAISLNSHTFWQNRSIEVSQTNKDEAISFSTLNICFETDINSMEVDNWAKESLSTHVEDEQLLVKYLRFSKYNCKFNNSFLDQLLEWKKTHFETFNRILSLMKDVELHPFTGGLGKTENLKNRGKEASKRISDEHRLSYTLQNDTVTFVSCHGHYEFH